ncbi:unnamed protein product [Oncorhynchus mykiss]|uniref:Tc1-like transposase DDE domain-containing protein n=1 Tax=Oncorhynchus mykiss TaxID=8022 RepID=A0A060X0R6_ONCMY|nr:unnamed protein product [Oncorhynchus mykiss]
MTWPPQSPNLNPIEMVWDELDRRVKEKQPTSAQLMWELLQDCWQSIPGEAGPEQEADPEGPGVCHAAEAPRVHPGAGVSSAGCGAAYAGRPDPHAAPDGAHQPDGVQQAEGAGAPAETYCGGPPAAQEPQEYLQYT